MHCPLAYNTARATPTVNALRTALLLQEAHTTAENLRDALSGKLALWTHCPDVRGPLVHEVGSYRSHRRILLLVEEELSLCFARTSDYLSARMREYWPQPRGVRQAIGYLTRGSFESELRKQKPDTINLSPRKNET